MRTPSFYVCRPGLALPSSGAASAQASLCSIIIIPSFKILPAKSSHTHPPTLSQSPDDDRDSSRMIGPGYLEDNLEHGAPLPERYVSIWSVCFGSSVPAKASCSLTASVMPCSRVACGCPFVHGMSHFLCVKLCVLWLAASPPSSFASSSKGCDLALPPVPPPLFPLVRLMRYEPSPLLIP